MKVNFLHTEDTNSNSCLSTKTSKKGKERLFFFTSILNEEWRELKIKTGKKRIEK